MLVQQQGYPQQGRFPTTLWTTGDWIEDSYELTLPAELPAGRYLLRVGMLHHDEHQQVWDGANERLRNNAEIGILTVGATP